MNISLNINKYNLRLNSPDEAKKYKEIQTAARALGWKVFKVISEGSINRLPETITVDPSHLFDNQFNSVEGHRVFGWFEETIFYNGNENKTQKTGYYLTGDVDRLRELQNDRCCCGWCGKQYSKATAPVFCTACIGGKYLTEDKLPLLMIRPLMEDRKPIESASPELVKAWKEIRPTMERLRAEAEVQRLKAKALKVLEDAKEKIFRVKHESQVQAALLNAGISTENLIYYHHTDIWVFGWRKDTSREEYCSFRAKIEAIPEKNRDVVSMLKSLEHQEKASI